MATTFQKRQKEMKRMERRKMKEEQRAQRKAERNAAKEAGVEVVNDPGAGGVVSETPEATQAE